MGLLTILLLGAGLITTPLSAEPLHVVVSSKPFHSLVSAVMAGRGEPQLLMEGSYSPHNYQLKPRDAYKLQQANLIFWGGVEIEPFMERALNTVASQATAVSLQESEGLELLPVRIFEEDANSHEPHDEHQEHKEHEKHKEHKEHKEHEEHEKHEKHDHHGTIDPHFWLDPVNAIAMVNSIATTLSQLDSDGRDLYHSNSAALSAQLQQLHRQLQQELEPLENQPFMVYHDSFQYLEQRYHLQVLGTITQHAEFGASAKSIQQVKTRITEHQIRCVFKEPQFSSRLVQVAIEGSPARIGVLDPLGSTLIAGPDLYFQLMRNIARALKSCLQH